MRLFTNFVTLNFLVLPNILLVRVSRFTINKSLTSGQKFKIFASSAFVTMPILALEAMHFFPFLFCYFCWHLITLRDLIVILFLFTIPKISIIVHILKKTCCARPDDHDSDFYRAIAPIYAFLLISVPLIPYLMLMYSKEATKNIVWLFGDNGCCGEVTKYYWHMITYLTLSYGISCVYVVAKIGFGHVEQPALNNMIVLVIWVIVTFPCGFAMMRKYGVQL